MIAIDTTTLPSYSSLRAAGVSGVLRYLSWLYRWGGTTHDYVNPKVIQAAEFGGLLANGFAVTLNWEYDAKDWLGGSSAGTSHATEAVRQARALGYPAGRAIYFSADFDMTRTQWDTACHAYAGAAAAVVRAAGYIPGVYGPYDVLTWCRDAGLMDRFWQAGMSTAWSGGRNANPWPGAHLRQRRHILIGGIDCDANDILIADYGQYTGGTVSNIVTGTDIVTALADGSTEAGLSNDGHSRPNNIAQVRTELAQVRAEQAAGFAADEKRDTVTLAAIQALTAGGTSIDTTAVLDAVKTAAAQESATVAALVAEVHTLRSALAAAATAEAGALAQPPA